MRYPTAGTPSAQEAQPFFVNSPLGIFLIHNGNITNAAALREGLNSSDSFFNRHLRTDSDSEVSAPREPGALHGLWCLWALRVRFHHRWDAVGGRTCADTQQAQFGQQQHFAVRTKHACAAQVLLNVLADGIHRAHQRCQSEASCDPNQVSGMSFGI